MTTTPDQERREKPDVRELQAEIEQTREQLGETVEALTAKLDVKSRARERMNSTKEQAVAQLHVTKQQASAKLDAGRTRAVQLTGSARNAATDEQGKPTPPVLAGAAALVSALVAVTVVAWRRRR